MKSSVFRLSPLMLALLTLQPATAQENAPAAAGPSDAAADSVELPAVQVRADAEAAPYVAPRAGSATKTDTPILETPQSISVIGEELLRDRGAQSLQEALRYSAGVLSDAYGLDNRTDSAVIRGTEFQSVLDGMRDQFNYYNTTRPDPYSLERIEIVRGPSSVLYGQGPVAGVVNLVSKRPKAEAAYEVVAEYGSFDRRQLAGDATGPLSADGRWLYRVVGLWLDSDTQVDFARYDRALLSPSLSWKPRENIEWTLLTTWQRDDSRNSISFLPHSGTLLPNPNGQIPVDRYTGEVEFDRFEAEKYAATSLLRWQVSPVWSLHQNLRLADNDNPYYTVYPDVFSNPSDPFLDEQDRTVGRYTYVELREQRDLTADHQAQARFATGALSHHLLLGIDYARSRYDSQVGYGYLDTPFDLYAPVYGTPVPMPELSTMPTKHAQFTGVYLQDQAKLGERWIGVAGLRHDRSRVQSEQAAPSKEDGTTGRLGLMYVSAGGLAPYLSWSQSFQPNTDVDPVTGKVFDPVRGEQVEAGIKYQPTAATLLTLTAYDLHEENRVVYGITAPAGITEVEARGVELEAATRLGRMDLTVAYTYTDAERREYTATPSRHAASLWAKYRWAGFELGGGLRHIGSTTDDSGTLQPPAVTLFDAMAAYNWMNWRFAVNATNLEDETYVSSCLVRGDCFYGNRGAVVGSVSWRY